LSINREETGFRADFCRTLDRKESLFHGLIIQTD